MHEGDFPEGIIVKFELSLNHFIPQICTPLECCAVNLTNIRDYVKTYREPRWGTKGACFHIERMTAPSPMQAVQQAILQRAEDPDVVRIVASSKDYMKLAELFPSLIGWQAHKPAPWIRRNNNVTTRIRQFYTELNDLTDISAPTPDGYSDFESFPDRFDIPVADFGKQPKRKSKTSRLSRATIEAL